MNKNYPAVLWFGATHGINDFIAGYLLWKISSNQLDHRMSLMAFLLYSLIAFGGQLPAGLLVDTIRNIKRPSWVALVLMLVSVILFLMQIPLLAILCIALASAMIHVCGGAACYSLAANSNTAAGIFTAPGVLGLLLGGLLAQSNGNILMWVVLALLLLVIAFYKVEVPYDNTVKKENEPVEWHDIFMLTVLLAIALRSLLWNIVQQWDTHMSPVWITGLAISAFSGKIVGGYLADSKIDTLYLYFSLAGAAITLYLAHIFPLLLFPGVFLLQSTTPMTLVVLQGKLPAFPALASGLALGIAILLAGIPTYLSDFRAILLHPTLLAVLGIAFLLTHVSVWRRKAS